MSQRRRRSQAVDSEDEEDAGMQDMDELVQRCVRFLLMRQKKLRPVRRTDLSKYVMEGRDAKGKVKLFNTTLEMANEELKSLFGLRLQEIHRRVRSNPSQSQRRTQTQQAPQAGGGAGLSKAYVLVTHLKDFARPKNESDWARYGFLTIVAAIIALTPECRISQQDLYRHLGKIGCTVKASKGHDEINSGNARDYLEQILPNQWYLDREKDIEGVFYKIGPRLWAELTSDELLQFIDVVYSEKGDDAKGLDDNAKRELNNKLVKEYNLAIGLDDDDE